MLFLPKKRRTKARLGYLFDVTYSGYKDKAVLHFIDPKTQTLFSWVDKSDHTSYLLTSSTEESLNEYFSDSIDFVGVESVVRYDSVSDKDVELRKLLAQNPLAIGGQLTRDRKESFRRQLEDVGSFVWESYIPYVDNFRYDMKYEVGMAYVVSKDKIVPYIEHETEKRINDVINIVSSKTERTEMIDYWARLFEESIPYFEITSLDIEVMPETPTTVPSAEEVKQPVIACSFASEKKRLVMILRHEGHEMGEGLPISDFVFFDDEKTLIKAIFDYINQYPFIVTFNGDSFDLLYLYNRAYKLGFKKDEIPIYISKKTCKLLNSIHIDLYPFLKNPSIVGYAYKGKYNEFGLDAISEALLGKNKIKLEKYIERLSYVELANYCMNDGDLTFLLLSKDNYSMFHLMIILSRMANLSLYQITRNKIGDWVRSTLFYICRQRNWLIPNQIDLASKGEIQTEAKIKGKKYQGAIVITPKSGAFFNVIVMDFASLYPTIVKEKNIGFSTINCGHPECIGKIPVPDTTHYICTKNRALEADVIGGLRDMRVFYYKDESKNKNNPLRIFYGILEQAIKVYINASYGVFGNEFFALFCSPVAESIAAFSRDALLKVIEKSEDLQIDSLYSDTDSLFLNNPTRKQTDLLQEWTRETLKLDLGIDKIYRYALFSTRKKNYLGIYQDGTLDVKGLTGKKRHTPMIIKEPFGKIVDILSKVNNLDEYNNAKIEVYRIAREYFLKIKNKEWDNISDLAYTYHLGMDLDEYKVNTQQVKAARQLIENGIYVGRGDKIQFIKATNEDKVVPLTTAKNDDVDINSYISELGTVLTQILDPMEIDWNEVVGKTTMDMFTGENKPFFLSSFMPTTASLDRKV